MKIFILLDSLLVREQVHIFELLHQIIVHFDDCKRHMAYSS